MTFTSQGQRVAAQRRDLLGDVVPVDELDAVDLIRRRRRRIEAGDADGALESVHLDQPDDGDAPLPGSDLAGVGLVWKSAPGYGTMIKRRQLVK